METQLDADTRFLYGLGMFSGLWWMWCGFAMSAAGSQMRQYFPIASTTGMQTIRYIPGTRSLLGWFLLLFGITVMLGGYSLFSYLAYDTGKRIVRMIRGKHGKN